jgi:hypothetical protein
MSFLMSVLNSTAAATTPALLLAVCQCSTDMVSSGHWFREHGRLDIQKRGRLPVRRVRTRHPAWISSLFCWGRVASLPPCRPPPRASLAEKTSPCSIGRSRFIRTGRYYAELAKEGGDA